MSLSASQVYMIQERCFPKSTSFFSTFHIGWIFGFFPVNLMSSTYTKKKNPLTRCTNNHSQFGTFSPPYFNRISSNSLSHNSLAKGWPYRFRWRGTTGSSILDDDIGHLCRGRRIQMSGHSDFGIFNNVWAKKLDISRNCIRCLPWAP